MMDLAVERAKKALNRRLRPLARADLTIGISLAALLLLLAVLRPWITIMGPMEGDILDRLKPAFTDGYLLGTDHIGRDIWSRMLAGLAWSLSAATAATIMSLLIGGGLGILAAERAGFVRSMVSWSVDTIIALPGIVIAICIIAVVGQGWVPLVLTLGLLSWPVFARVVYAEALSLMQRNYVIAAQIQGARRLSILWQHVTPGLRPTLLVMAAFHFADMLIAESALSFLGIGAPLGAPTWGNMLAESRQYLFRAPWMLLGPAGAIILTVVTLNLIGDALAAYFRGRERGENL